MGCYVPCNLGILYTFLGPFLYFPSHQLPRDLFAIAMHGYIFVQCDTTLLNAVGLEL